MSFFFDQMGGGSFPFGGGFSHGGFGHPQEEDGGGDADTQHLYDLLGVSKDAEDNQLKKAYRTLARQLHPDRHPNEQEKYKEKFQEVQHAYEILSDPDKRKIYDRYGEDGLKSGGGQHFSGSRLEDLLFGGRHRGGGRGRGPKKAPAIKVPWDVTLEDFYFGRTVNVTFERLSLCKSCSGKGGSKVNECDNCRGGGMETVTVQRGPILMQTQRECSKCGGEGKIIRKKDQCKICKGKGSKVEKRTVDVHIPAGGKHGESVTLRNQGHEMKDVPNGDVIVILRCEKHERFTRVGADLAMNYELTLREALCGYDIKIPHFGKRTIRIKSKPLETTQMLQLKVVYSMGMPQKNSNHVKGHLYIKFKIKLPEELDDGVLKKLSKLLPGGDDEKENKPKNNNNNNNKNNNNRGKKNNKYKNHKKKSSNKKFNMRGKLNPKKKEEPMEVLSDEDEDGPIEIEEESHIVEGEPRTTPYSAKSAYDEDDDQQQEGVRCQHM